MSSESPPRFVDINTDQCSDFPLALGISTFFQTGFFIVLGLLGYLLEGAHNISGAVFEALPKDGRSVALYGMIQPSVILQAGLFINVLGREIWRFCSLDRFTSCAGGPRFSKFWWTRQSWWVLLLCKLLQSVKEIASDTF